MPMTIATSDLLKTLDPAALATRSSYSARRRPFVAGYAARYAAAGAGLVYGVNDPGTLTVATNAVLHGASAATNATPFTYAIPAGTVTLPTETDLTEADDYLSAIMVAYKKGDEANATVVRRIEKDGAALTDNLPWWKVATASTFITAYGYSSTHTDWQSNWILRIIVPVTANITKLVDVASAGEGILTVTDFMAAGGSGKTSKVFVNRVPA